MSEPSGMRRTAKRIAGALLAGAVLCGGMASAQEAEPLRPGEVLEQSNWQKAEGLLPPEILKHYERGEYANPIVDWPSGLQGRGADFLTGTEANRGRFTVNERGTSQSLLRFGK